MRTFTQRQGDVVLMFVGTTGFSDLLDEPRWTKYFVHLHTRRIDYFSRAGSLSSSPSPYPTSASAMPKGCRLTIQETAL